MESTDRSNSTAPPTVGATRHLLFTNETPIPRHTSRVAWLWATALRMPHSWHLIDFDAPVAKLSFKDLMLAIMRGELRGGTLLMGLAQLQDDIVEIGNNVDDGIQLPR